MFDAPAFLVLIVVLAALFNPLWVFLGAVVVITVINIGCCGWLDRAWDDRIEAGHAKQVEAKLERMRKSSLMKHPVAWIARGSDAWLALGAMLINDANSASRPLTARIASGPASTAEEFRNSG